MSRDMMGRITHLQPTNPAVAFGGMPAQTPSPTQRALHAQGSRVGGYGTSQLGARSLVRQVGAEISAPTPSRVNRMRRPQPEQSTDPRRRINSRQNRPSAGFKEPPGRNYNPYA